MRKNCGECVARTNCIPSVSLSSTKIAHQLALQPCVKMSVGFVQENERDTRLEYPGENLHRLVQPGTGHDKVEVFRQDLVVIGRVDARGSDPPGHLLVVVHIDKGGRIEPGQQLSEQPKPIRVIFLQAEE